MNNCAFKKNQNIIQKIFGKSLTSTKKEIAKPKTPHKPSKARINNSNFLYKLNTTREVLKTSDTYDDASSISDFVNFKLRTQKEILKNIKNKNEIPKKCIIIKRNNINLRNKKMKDFYNEMQKDLNNDDINRKIVNSNSVIARKNQKFTTGKIYNPSSKRISDFHLSLSVDKYNNMNNSINYNKERANKKLRRSFDVPNYLQKNIVNTKLKIRLKKNFQSDNQSAILYSIINNSHKNNQNITKKTFENNLHNSSNINIYNSNATYNNLNITINGNNNSYMLSRASIDPYEKRRRLRTDINNNIMNLDKINKNATSDGYRTRKYYGKQKKNTNTQKISEKTKNSTNSPRSVKIRKIRRNFAINNNNTNNKNNNNDQQKVKIQRFNKIKTTNKIIPNNKNKKAICEQNKIINNNSVKKIYRNINHTIKISDIDHDILTKTFNTESNDNNHKNLLNLDETNKKINDNNSIIDTERTNSNKTDVFESGTIGSYNKEKLYEIFQVISDVKVKSFIEYEEDKKHKLQENNNNNIIRNIEDIDNNLNINEIITSNSKTYDDKNKFIEDRDEYNIVLKETFSKDRFSFKPTNNDSNETLQDTFRKNVNKSTILNKKDFLNSIDNSFQKERRESWITKALNNYKAKKNVNHIKSTKNIESNKMAKSISNDFQLKKK